MGFNFPSGPVVDQIFGNYKWDGEKWKGLGALAPIPNAVPFNGTLLVTAAAGALTIAVKTLLGVDPSTGDPVTFRFPTGGGGSTAVNVTAPLSIVVPSGAQVGFTSAIANRLWIAAFNDAGTVRLAVRCCQSWGASGGTIYNPPEQSANDSTLLPGNNSHTFYTTGGAVAAKFWIWLGFATWESGVVTAGVWTAPSLIALVTQGSPRPGHQISNFQYNQQGSVSITGSTAITEITNSAMPITVLSAANFVEFSWDGYVYLRSATLHQQGGIAPYRDTVPIGNGFGANVYTQANTDAIGDYHIQGRDKPNASGALTYRCKASNALSTGLIQYVTGNHRIGEIMG